MNERDVVLNALHEAKAILIHHAQTKQGRNPGETIDALFKVLDSTAVNEAVNKLRK